MSARDLPPGDGDAQVARKPRAWQPGWQTADQLEDEWYEAHGWTTEPPADVIAQWSAVRQAEADYRQCPSASESDDVEIGTLTGVEWWVPAHPLTGPAGGIAVELCQPADGLPIFVAFSSVGALVAALGEYQPWLKLAKETVEALSGGILLTDPGPGVLPTMWTKERVDLLKETINV
jgi:hypothetical protein